MTSFPLKWRPLLVGYPLAYGPWGVKSVQVKMYYIYISENSKGISVKEKYTSVKVCSFKSTIHDISRGFTLNMKLWCELVLQYLIDFIFVCLVTKFHQRVKIIFFLKCMKTLTVIKNKKKTHFYLSHTQTSTHSAFTLQTKTNMAFLWHFTHLGQNILLKSLTNASGIATCQKT